MPDPRLRALLIGLSGALLYFLGAQLGFAFSGKGILTPLWPAAAASAAIALLFGPRHLWAVLVYVAIDFTSYNPKMAPWAWIEPLGIVLAASSVAMLGHRLRFDPRIDQLRSVFLLPALAATYALINGAAITVGYCYALGKGHCVKVGPLDYLAESFTGDFFGGMVCLPALLGWGLVLRERLAGQPWPPLRFDPARTRFLAVAVICALLALAATHKVGFPVDFVGFLVLPLLVWAAFQFSRLFVYTAIMLTGLVAISLQLSSGMVDFDNPAHHLWSLLLFLLTMSMLTMIVHVTAQRQQAIAGAQATQAERARLDLILHSASEAVVSFDAEGKVTYLNPAAENLFGRERAAVGVNVSELMPDKRLRRLIMADDFLTTVGRARLAPGRPLDMTLADGSGTQRNLEVALTTYRNDDGWHATAFIHDVTQRVRAANEIREALAKQEELNKLRSRFISMTSHEFRTPLATILSSTELLQHYSERMPPDERAEVLGSIAKAVDRMTRMIERVLFFGRTDAHLLDFTPHHLDLVPLCQQLLTEVRNEWPEAKVAIETEFPPSLPGMFDEKLLRHAIGNLLSNAVKYSREARGPVRFALSKSGERTRIEIADQGIGIPAEALPRLFEEFHRAANVGNIPGTGLGLAIVKRSVELHGGRIEVASELGVGTRFTLTL